MPGLISTRELGINILTKIMSFVQFLLNRLLRTRDGSRRMCCVTGAWFRKRK